jgi:hypothetical protein
MKFEKVRANRAEKSKTYADLGGSSALLPTPITHPLSAPRYHFGPAPGPPRLATSMWE